MNNVIAILEQTLVDLQMEVEQSEKKRTLAYRRHLADRQSRF